ncbi:MAG: hypothetical protein K9H65_06455 [Bacteroidales bacterium]|nr:hypothetical protein [Bacteroidales bacterium]
MPLASVSADPPCLAHSSTRPTGGVIALLPEKLLVDTLYLLVSCGPDNRSDGVGAAIRVGMQYQ